MCKCIKNWISIFYVILHMCLWSMQSTLPPSNSQCYKILTKKKACNTQIHTLVYQQYPQTIKFTTSYSCQMIYIDEIFDVWKRVISLVIKREIKSRNHSKKLYQVQNYRPVFKQHWSENVWNKSQIQRHLSMTTESQWIQNYKIKWAPYKWNDE